MDYRYFTKDHGYPLLIIIYFNIVQMYMFAKVAGYRRKHNIKYPTVYHKTDMLFNCYQRVHLNTLELLPIFYSLFIPCAIVYPLIASVFGFLFVTSRFPYAWGYYTGEPDKRRWGSWGGIGFLGLFITLSYITLCQFGLVDYK